MESIIVIIILVVVVAICLVVGITIANLKYRLKQHVLKETGLSSSSISGYFQDAIETGGIERFITDHPSYTEETLKNVFKTHAKSLVNKTSNINFLPEVNEKMMSDNKLEVLMNQEIVRAQLIYYRNTEILNAEVVFTNQKDETNMYLYYIVEGDSLKLKKYEMAKGSVVGF